MSNDKSKEGLGYWRVGLQYFHLVKSVVNEAIRQGNTFVVIMPEEFSWDVYEQKTKWSDHNLIVPVLFDFYHALEVVFKGFLIASGETISMNHKLSELLSGFESHFPKHTIGSIARKYILPGQLSPILTSFCAESGISIDQYYQALKYPESTSGRVYQHDPLMNHGESGLPFLKELAADIDQIVAATVRLGKSLCEVA